MEIGLVKKVDIDGEMQQSYLDYAMSVIVARALPDARDGLKPVQRRILYAMYDMGLRPDSEYKKSARIVGEVLGKYHPHGDMAVYEAMARLAQSFTMRYPLIDGQGNFGSVDGDPPAAMRYTEARLLPYAIELLAQIDRDTVDFVRNFDDTLREPVVLPAALPNLLVNGASGIAVGMATSIPPHNLVEVLDAMIYMLSRWEKQDDIAIEDLMKYIKGPDFPTGGYIIQEGGQNDLLMAYASGKGKITLRGKVQDEELGRGRDRVIITELPYLVNKAGLIERIAELVREGELEGIADLRDESDRHGMRIVIELSRTADRDSVLRELYRRTPLQTTFSIALLALVGGEPRLLPIKQALRVYIEHRLSVVRRRSEFDLARARQREHILAGLRIAISNIDEIITIIRNAPDSDQAKSRLIRRFKLSDVQAQAILDMPLKRLASLERKKIEQEYKDVLKTIKDLETLLKSPKKLRDVVSEEFANAKALFGDRRRTQIITLREGESAKLLLTANEITPAKEVWVGLTNDGLIARTIGDALPKVSGRAAPLFVLKTNTHHTLYIVSESGKAASVTVESLPETEVFENGTPLSKVTPCGVDFKVAAIFSTPAREKIEGEKYIFLVTRAGLVKKTAIAELPGPSAQLFTVVKVNPGDAVIWSGLSHGNNDIVLFTSLGMAIRFSEHDVRPMGLVAAGVAGIKLASDDAVIGASRFDAKGHVLLLSSLGRAWHVLCEDFPLQGRYGQGVIACRLNRGERITARLFGKPNHSGILRFSKAASRAVRVDMVAVKKRGLAGQPAVEIKAGDQIVGLTDILDDLDFWQHQDSPAARRAGAKRASSVKKT
ncbi:MAG: DNA topoisomerase 4 subunit A [Anaerolineae bacterium]|nr:DNA topoisomerase 4 subunit A [Anaerolineae bacterium]